MFWKKAVREARDYSSWKPIGDKFRTKDVYVAAEEADTYIYLKCIEVNYEDRRKGLGSGVIKEVLIYAEEKRKAVVLETVDMGTPLEVLYKFYEKLGFKRETISHINYRHNMVYLPEGSIYQEKPSNLLIAWLRKIVKNIRHKH